MFSFLFDYIGFSFHLKKTKVKKTIYKILKVIDAFIIFTPLLGCIYYIEGNFLRSTLILIFVMEMITPVVSIIWHLNNGHYDEYDDEKTDSNEDKHEYDPTSVYDAIEKLILYMYTECGPRFSSLDTMSTRISLINIDDIVQVKYILRYCVDMKQQNDELNETAKRLLKQNRDLRKQNRDLRKEVQTYTIKKDNIVE